MTADVRMLLDMWARARPSAKTGPCSRPISSIFPGTFTARRWRPSSSPSSAPTRFSPRRRRSPYICEKTPRRHAQRWRVSMPTIRCAAFRLAGLSPEPVKLFDLERQIGARRLAIVRVVHGEPEHIGTSRSAGQIDRDVGHVVYGLLARCEGELSESLLSAEHLPVRRSHLKIDHE